MLALIPGLLSIFYHPLFVLVAFVFWVWMLVDAIRREEWMWVILIIIGLGLAALLYYFFVFRASAPAATRGFELPGAFNRKRIKELQAQIHHLDKAHHHSQLGDIYFQQGKLTQAEACYRAAMERDSEDEDTRAHLGQCLLRQKRAAEAKPLLESVVSNNPSHDYGHTMMALAETQSALGETGQAMESWKKVTENHSYARARVQLAELLAASGQADQARAELREVIEEDAYAPAFQRRKDRVWISRAKGLLRRI